MDMDEHRRKRLRALVDEEAEGNVSAYARKYGQDATRLRQILNPNYRGGRSFGEGTARRLEKDLGLPNLYFDRGLELRPLIQTLGTKEVHRMPQSAARNRVLLKNKKQSGGVLSYVKGEKNSTRTWRLQSSATATSP